MPDDPAMRVLNDPPLDGVTNMARDEALMTRAGSGESPPTLRLYQWIAPTLSLGYFQRYADYEALPPPAGGLPVVRRPTGGGAILHDLELTYSLALPVGHHLLLRGATRLYEVFHEAVIATLADFGLQSARCGTSDDSGPARGPFFCFARRHRYDILIGADKITGSAQRRTRRAVLQHGSIILANRFAQQPTAAAPLPFDESIAHLRLTLPQRFAESTNSPCFQGYWSPEELDVAERFQEKYAADAWARRT